MIGKIFLIILLSTLSFLLFTESKMEWTDSPLTGGEVTEVNIEQISSNWAYDHATTVDVHHAATTDTGPVPNCSGTTTYQDGDGGYSDLFLFMTQF